MVYKPVAAIEPIIICLFKHLQLLKLTMTTTNSSVSVTLLLSVLCLGLAMMMFMGGWCLVELKVQQQETAMAVQQLKEKWNNKMSNLLNYSYNLNK